MRYGPVAKIVATVGLCTLALTACDSAVSGEASSAPHSGSESAGVTQSGEGSESTTPSTTSSGDGAPSGAVTEPGGNSGTSGPSSSSTTIPPPSESTEAAPTTSTGATAPSSGMAACRTADLKLALGQPGGAAGSIYVPLIFTNAGDAECSLHGFPKVAYVAGDDGHQVGTAAAETGDRGTAVVLQPGDSAQAMLQEVNIANFPAKDCKPADVRGLRVYPPGEDKALYVPQDGARGCAKKSLGGGQFQLSVRAVGVE